ncbi:MAG: sensor domain-containing diguanylate cyclase [Pseudothermotoga sp.]
MNQLFKNYILSKDVTFQNEVASLVKQSVKRLGMTITHFIDECNLWQSMVSISLKEGTHIYTLLMIEPNRSVVRHVERIIHEISVSPVLIIDKGMTVLFCNKVEFRQLKESQSPEWRKILEIARTSIENQCVCQEYLSIGNRIFRVTAEPADDETVMIFRDITAEKIAEERYQQLKVISARFTLMENILELLEKGETDLQKIGKKIYEEVKNVIPVDTFYLALIEEDEIVIKYGVHQEREITNLRIKRGYTGLSNYVIDKGKFVYIPNTKTMHISPYKAKAIFAGETKQVWSYVGIPIKIDEKIVGAVSFQKQGANAFSDTHLALFEFVGKEITIALKMKSLVDELDKERSKYREIAIRDPLTGCYTRYYFAEYFTKYRGIIERRGGQICFAMIDVNDFKHINDKYGHAVGDKVLNVIGQLLSKNTRKMDLVVRYGGDEFLLMLPDLDLKKATHVVERISKALAQLIIPEIDERITLSFGIAVYDGSKPLEEVLKDADEKMYEMKRGKNL